MVDVSALVVAIVSLVGTFIVTGGTLLYQYFSDERKRLSETEKLVRKYRDPVLWATSELQSRFYNICDQGLLNLYDNPAKHDLVVIYTAYLIGQYLTWTSIFKRQAQFLSFASKAGTDHKRLNDLLIAIMDRFSTDSRPFNETMFMLWRGQQSAIGELMAVHDGKELVCMGYAAFLKKWNTDKDFRQWFASTEEGMAVLASGERGSVRPELRLVYLHHLLYELLCLLDPKGVQWDRNRLSPCYMDEEEKEFCKCQPCIDEVATKKRAAAARSEKAAQQTPSSNV